MREIKGDHVFFILLASSLMLLGSFYLLFLSPKLKASNGLKEDLRNVEMELQKARPLTKNVELLREDEKKKWQATQARVDNIPAKINIPEFMERLGKLVSANHISDATFANVRHIPKPSGRESKIQMADFLIKISFHCQYRDLAYLLKGLDMSPVWAVVESLEVRKTFPHIYAELRVRPIKVGK